MKCKRARVTPGVAIKLDQVDKKAHYSGLHTCGSVWTCPVCAAAVAEVRRKEISDGIAWAYANGYKVVMVTLTTPHYGWQSCSDLLEGFTGALKYLRSGKTWQGIKERYGFVGMIRSLETLHGKNGWHTHTHEAWIVDQEADADQLRAQVLTRWRKACEKRGMIPRGKVRAFLEHSIDIQDNIDSSDYLAKQDNEAYLRWGGDRELTGHFKKSSKGVHPFQLAAAQDRRHWELFTEYAEAFKGRAAVYWSPGLKKLALNQEKEISDAEAADQVPVESEELALLDVNAWNQVIRENARAKLLSVAENQGQEGIDFWLKTRGLDSVTRTYAALVHQLRDDPVKVVVLQHQEHD